MELARSNESVFISLSLYKTHWLWIYLLASTNCGFEQNCLSLRKTIGQPGQTAIDYLFCEPRKSCDQNKTKRNFNLQFLFSQFIDECSILNEIDSKGIAYGGSIQSSWKNKQSCCKINGHWGGNNKKEKGNENKSNFDLISIPEG